MKIKSLKVLKSLEVGKYKSKHPATKLQIKINPWKGSAAIWYCSQLNHQSERFSVYKHNVDSDNTQDSS